MNIQVISDIHLEFGDFNLPVKGCDVLVAAGDIGVGTEGLKWLQTLDMPVIYVAGNHEYWGFEITGLNATLSETSKGSNVYYLERGSVIIEGVKFIGCTLWTDFNTGKDEALLQELEGIMNDFRYISLDNDLITPQQLIEINQESKDWLNKELYKAHNGPTVVVTHHAPSTQSWVSAEENYLKYAYCNVMDSILEEHQVDLWVHGHIHRSSDYTRHGVRIVCNPRGYHGYQLVEKFNPEKTIQI